MIIISLLEISENIYIIVNHEGNVTPYHLYQHYFLYQKYNSAFLLNLAFCIIIITVQNTKGHSFQSIKSAID